MTDHVIDLSQLDDPHAPAAPRPQRSGRAQRPSGEGPLLRVDGLHAGYGTQPVLHGISFDIAAGETAVLLGLNGAGKTTTALSLCGAIKPSGGGILMEGRDVTGWNVRQAVRSGVVMVPEGRRVFPDLSVERNLEVGSWTQRRDAAWTAEQQERVFGYFPRLRERRDQLAGTLSGGEQQMLAIGRGLMANPKVLIIDEASLGLAPVITEGVFDIVAQITTDGVTVVLIEQHVGALRVADVALIMEQGTIVAEIRGDELADPSQVRKAFLG